MSSGIYDWSDFIDQNHFLLKNTTSMLQTQLRCYKWFARLLENNIKEHDIVGEVGDVSTETLLPGWRG